MPEADDDLKGQTPEAQVEEIKQAQWPPAGEEYVAVVSDLRIDDGEGQNDA